MSANAAAIEGQVQGEDVEVKTVGRSFIALATAVQVLVLVGFAILAKPTSLKFNDPTQDVQLYNIYIGVTLMMFVGFGYLMTFLRWYGLGAVGLTMFVTCLGMQVAMLIEKLFAHGFVEFEVNVMTLLEGDFAVAAFLISFGGIIGKVSPTQLVVMTVLEAVFYSANTQLFLFKYLKIKDCGGSIVVHTFGAYFGLAASWILGKPSKMEKEASSQVSDIFSFIGTVFLWLYWPSFVAGLLTPGSLEADIAITNTVLALLGSTVCTFIMSAALSGKMLRPADIQSATLAGGVSIGAVANLNIHPIGAVLVGCASGVLSTVGYNKVQGFLFDKLGLHDTCGIHNLHGMPGIFGALCSVFFPLFIKQGNAGTLGVPVDQLLGTVGTVFFSTVAGLVTGLCMKLLKDNGESFSDRMYWEVAKDKIEEHQFPEAEERVEV